MWWKRGAPPKNGPSEATLARIKAERELEKTLAQTPKYQALGDRLRKIREDNNFAAAFRHSIQGGNR